MRRNFGETAPEMNRSRRGGIKRAAGHVLTPPERPSPILKHDFCIVLIKPTVVAKGLSVKLLYSDKTSSLLDKSTSEKTVDVNSWYQTDSPVGKTMNDRN